jgi:MOSC domain-containing protein YiiM
VPALRTSWSSSTSSSTGAPYRRTGPLRTVGKRLAEAGGLRHARPVDSEHLTTAELEAGLDEVRAAPADGGRVELLVRRPAVDEREQLDEAKLDPDVGMVGDTWLVRGSSRTPDGASDPDKQLTVMNARLAALVAGGPSRRALAGDQIYVDLDISHANLPAGSRLALGEAVVEITQPPHAGCAKFAARFGKEALRFVNSPVGRELRLRGANARIVVAGAVRAGDAVRKLPD